MNKWMVVSTLALLGAIAIGCAKKDDGPAPAGGCPAAHIGTSIGCMPQAQCPPGLVQSNTNAAMCMNPQTLQAVTTQVCTSGQVLTMAGCLTECEGKPGYGNYGVGACLKGVSGSQYGIYSNSYNSQGQYIPGYQYQPTYGQQYYGYGNPYAGYGYRYW